MAFEFCPMRSLIYVDVVKEQYRHKLQHWLYRIHIPESISHFGPYVTKYAFYNALPVPPEGERFGTRRMQMTEHYWLINELKPEMKTHALSEYMPLEVLRWQGMIPDEEVTGAISGDDHRKSGNKGGCPPFVFAHVPINWEEDFKGKGRLVQDGPNYRWQFVINYPEGVTPEEGDAWFYNQVVPYFTEQKDVTRFLSSKIIKSVNNCPFHRLVELWFDGPEQWYEVAVTNAQAIQKPKWAQQDKFPFLKPNFNIVGMFLTDMAASDNMNGSRTYVTMR